MSVSQVVNIKQSLAANVPANVPAIFGVNQGYWEYLNYDGEFVCYTVRKWNHLDNNKVVTPWTLEDGKLVNRWFKAVSTRPIYNEHLLKIHPDKTVLIVEGEKTTDAATKLFPEYVCISWLGGSKIVKKSFFR